jgi:hypothetical protein
MAKLESVKVQDDHFFLVESNNEKNISFSFGSYEAFFVFVCFNVSKTDPNV